MSKRKPPRFTSVSALAEAKRRWGKAARVDVRKSVRFSNKPDAACSGCYRKDCDLQRKTYLVGVRALGGLVFRLHGVGHSWEEAFASADKAGGGQCG